MVAPLPNISEYTDSSDGAGHWYNLGRFLNFFLHDVEKFSVITFTFLISNIWISLFKVQNSIGSSLKYT